MIQLVAQRSGCDTIFRKDKKKALLILFQPSSFMPMPVTGRAGLVSENLEWLANKAGVWTERGGGADGRGEERGDRLGEPGETETWAVTVGLEPCCSLIAKDRPVVSCFVLFCF